MGRTLLPNVNISDRKMPVGMAELDMGLRSHCMPSLSFESLALTKMKYPEFLKVQTGKNSSLKA